MSNCLQDKEVKRKGKNAVSKSNPRRQILLCGWPAVTSPVPVEEVLAFRPVVTFQAIEKLVLFFRPDLHSNGLCGFVFVLDVLLQQCRAHRSKLAFGSGAVENLLFGGFKLPVFHFPPDDCGHRFGQSFYGGYMKAELERK